MRKIIGLGETVFDIIFKNEQPISGRPGGSVFNSLISLGRLGQNATFISEFGADRIGDSIKNFLAENNVDSDYVCMMDGNKTSLALAFLDKEQKADYLFYKDYPSQRLDCIMPEINQDDIVLIGSFFALNPVLRNRLVEVLEEARNKKAIVYYDVNFRKTHVNEVRHLMPYILDNFEYSSIIKGSDEDFENIYNESDPKAIYKDRIEFYCKNFIYTKGADGAKIFSNGFEKDYHGNKIDPVSTVGAGDSFNAGIVFGLMKHNVTFDELKNGISEEKWDCIAKYAIDFSSFVCTTYENYISEEFAAKYV